EQIADQPTVAATLRSVLAARYHDLGMDQAAADLGQLVLSDRRSILGEEHDDTLFSIEHLGVYMNALGKRDEAERLLREALDKSRRVRGNDNPSTLGCMADLGRLFLDQGKLSEAELLLRESL